jgi:hypothetical protein
VIPLRGKMERETGNAHSCAVVLSCGLATRDGEKGQAVKRLNVLDFYNLGEALGKLTRLLSAKEQRGPIFFQMVEVQEALKNFSQQDAFNIAKDDAAQLHANLDNFIVQHCTETKPDGQRIFRDFNEYLDTWTYWPVSQAIDHLIHVFKSECRSVETYSIERKLIYDTTALLHKASEEIRNSIRPLIEKDALKEIDEAGRCLALESYTAAGFHALRGLELVMDDYYRELSKKDSSFRSWADYIGAFEKLEKNKEERKSKYPSRKVISMLDRIRELDRNPLMHPRDVLDEMSADTLFTISVAAITEMAKDIRDLKANPEQTELLLVASDAKPEKRRRIQDGSYKSE